MLKALWSDLKQIPWKATGPYIAISLIGVMTASLVPRTDNGVEQVAQTAPYNEAAYHYPLEAWAALLAAIFTGGLLIYAFFQWRDSRISSERQLRAYITVKAKTLDGAAIGEHPILGIEIKNSGQTPAYKFKQASRAGYQPFPLPGEPPETIDNNPHGMQLGPGDTSYTHPKAKYALTQGHVDGMAGKTQAFYFVGQIDFVDVFGKKRWVKYCFYSGGNVDWGRVAVHKGGNVTSEDDTL